MNRLACLRPEHALALASIIAAVLIAGPASGATNARPTVVDGLSALYLQYSAWADQNDLDPGGAVCVGIAGARKGAVDMEHTAFRCTVTRGEKPAGVVIATAFGPEWLRVTRIVRGTLKPDRGVGAVPTGPQAMIGHDAQTALARSSWAHAHEVGKAFCTGVGPYKLDIIGQRRFGAFSCATMDRAGRRSGTVLVQVAGTSSVRVVRTLS